MILMGNRRRHARRDNGLKMASEIANGSRSYKMPTRREQRNSEAG